MSAPLDFRVILHVDMDAFYAAVEMKRLGVPPDIPLVVQQWQGVIAINYAARAAGVKRGMVVDEVRRRCPAARFVHVEVIGHESNDTQLQNNPPTSDIDVAAQRGETKVSLERYRRASSRVFASISSFLKLAEGRTKSIIERASIDEAFLDVTSVVDARLDMDRRQPGFIPNQPPLGTKIVAIDGEDQLDFPDEFSQSTSARRLLVGSQIAAEIRAKISGETGYSCSAGIASNKMLAKFASARNKPSGQTLIPRESVQALMVKTPISKIRFLGGKLGSKLAAAGAEMAGQVQEIQRERLRTIVGPSSLQFVYDIVRGIDRSEVSSREVQKSMLAAKSFSLEISIEGLEKWTQMLAGELDDRMKFEETVNKRTATALTISFRNSKHETRSRTASMPSRGGKNRDKRLFSEAISVLRREDRSNLFPCNFVGMTASKFIDLADEKDTLNGMFKEVEVAIATTDGFVGTAFPENHPNKPAQLAIATKPASVKRPREALQDSKNEMQPDVMKLLRNGYHANVAGTFSSEQERLDFELARKLQSEERKLVISKATNVSHAAEDSRRSDLKKRNIRSFFEKQ